MKREQIEKIVEQTGLVCVHPHNIRRAFALVEQATLERAAQACEQSEAYRGSVFAARIRALKEDACE